MTVPLRLNRTRRYARVTSVVLVAQRFAPFWRSTCKTRLARNSNKQCCPPLRSFCIANAGTAAKRTLLAPTRPRGRSHHKRQSRANHPFETACETAAATTAIFTIPRAFRGVQEAQPCIVSLRLRGFAGAPPAKPARFDLEFAALTKRSPSVRLLNRAQPSPRPSAFCLKGRCLLC